MNHPLKRRVIALMFLGMVAQLSAAKTIVYANDTPPPPPPHAGPVAAPVYVIPSQPLPAPPLLSPVMRAVYAPFYGAGLVLRYGLYYGVVAPLEVFGRALNYGVSGGIDDGEQDR